MHVRRSRDGISEICQNKGIPMSCGALEPRHGTCIRLGVNPNTSIGDYFRPKRRIIGALYMVSHPSLDWILCPRKCLLVLSSLLFAHFANGGILPNLRAAAFHGPASVSETCSSSHLTPDIGRGVPNTRQGDGL